MIEHRPWSGSDYEVGINGQRVAIVGYSHHSNCPDNNGLTEKIVSGVIAGDNLSFFTSIREYFSFESNSDFWSRVLFFNFLPDCVGTSEHRFDNGTPEQIRRAQSRFLEIIERERPQKAFIFSKKGWSEFPPTLEEQSKEDLRSLGPSFPDFRWGTYGAGNQLVMAFGLRHPQRAPKKSLQDAVASIMAMPPLS